MTPKDKANELIIKFSKHSAKSLNDDSEFDTIEEAKKCAIISVMDQLMEHSCYTLNDERWAYWAKVEVEIKKLNQ